MTYYKRRAALVTLERAWSENRWTAEGRLLHEKVHESSDENRPGIHVCRGLLLRSHTLGLSGIADMVKFHRVSEHGIPVPGLDGVWRP